MRKVKRAPSRGRIALFSSFLFGSLFPFSFLVFGASGAKGKFRIVIDAGHGGKDSGAVGWRRLREKDVNLKAALALAKRLRRSGLFEVKLTRGGDEFIPLAGRCEISNDWKADLFVSIHANSSSDRRDSGYEVYFLSEKASDPEAARLALIENQGVRDAPPPGFDRDKALASSILGTMARTERINLSSELAAGMVRRLKKAVGRLVPDRGVKQAELYVLHWTDAPAVLVEMGFVTNKRDASKLRSSGFRDKLVKALDDEIEKYAKETLRSPRRLASGGAPFQ